jgi:hypothetical protein
MNQVHLNVAVNSLLIIFAFFLVVYSLFNIIGFGGELAISSIIMFFLGVLLMVYIYKKNNNENSGYKIPSSTFWIVGIILVLLILVPLYIIIMFPMSPQF